MSDKVTGVNVEGRLYEFLAGQAVRGSCTALAGDWIKPVVLPEGVSLVDGILLVVSFLNGNSVGLDKPISIYSSDGENFFYDQSLTDPVTFPPADCYEVELVSGQEYTYMNWPCMQYGDTVLPIRDAKGHTVSANAWSSGDSISAVLMTDLFMLLGGNSGGSFDICYPIGCVYTQYPEQKSPNELWGDISTWEELNYGGAFFRAEGGNALAFNNSKEVTAVSGAVLTIPSSGAVVGSLIYDPVGNETRTVTAVSGNSVTVNSAFTSPILTNVLIGQSQGTAKNGLTISNTLSLRASNSDSGTANSTSSSGAWSFDLAQGFYGNQTIWAVSGCSRGNGASRAREMGTGNETRVSQRISMSAHAHNMYLRGSVSLGNGDTETRGTNFSVRIWKRTA